MRAPGRPDATADNPENRRRPTMTSRKPLRQVSDLDDETDLPSGPSSETGPDPVAPTVFRQAVESLTRTAVRPEVLVEPLRPPQRLAPWSYAISTDVRGPDGDELATGRLVLLHDPEGFEAWD